MNKENLALLAEGHKLIALAYAREAGVNLDQTVTTVQHKNEVAETSKPEAPKQDKAVKAEPEKQPEVSEEEEGYTLDELNAMTVKQLKELASENEITIPKDTKKADIIDLIMDGAVESDEDAEEATEDVQTDAEETVEADAVEADTEESDDDAEELTIADVEGMNLKDLKDLAKEYEVDLPKKATKDQAVEEIVKALFEEDEIEAYYGNDEDEQEPTSDEEEGEEITPEDLEEMSLSELKALADEYEVKYPKLVKADKLRTILVEALFEEEEEEDDTTDLDAEDLAETYGLNDMTVEELQELLTENEIKAKGNKQALIAKILEAIEEGVIEVDEEEEGK